MIITKYQPTYSGYYSFIKLFQFKTINFIVLNYKYLNFNDNRDALAHFGTWNIQYFQFFNLATKQNAVLSRSTWNALKICTKWETECFKSMESFIIRFSNSLCLLSTIAWSKKNILLLQSLRLSWHSGTASDCTHDGYGLNKQRERRFQMRDTA